MTTTIPVADDLFTWPSDAPQLIGSRCVDCGLMAFPTYASCPRCAGATERALFAREGTLWTWTTQQFIPKSPPYAITETEETFVPYLVGYVELADQGRIEGRIVGIEPADLRIGMAMEVTVVPFMIDDEGREVVTYAFRPSQGGDR